MTRQRLGDLATARVGFATWRRSTTSKLLVTVVSVKNVREGGRLVGPFESIYHSVPARRASVSDPFERFRLRAGDVLVTARGTRFEVGLVRESEGSVGCIFDSNMIRLRPHRGVSGAVLAAMLSTRRARGALSVLCRWSSTVFRIAIADLEDLTVPMPEPQDQARIEDEIKKADSAYGEAVMAAENAIRVAKAQLEEAREALLAPMFIEETRP